MSEQETTTTIEVAAYGWQGAAWDGFYPEDIPDDWRLDFYANEFFAVVVPWEAWCQAGDEELLLWQGQVSDDFRFYWELPASDAESVSRLQRLLDEELFAEHWGGVVGMNATTPFLQYPFSDGQVSPRILAQVLELRPLRELIERQVAQITEQGGKHLLLVVEAGAQASLRSARDLAQLLGGG